MNEVTRRNFMKAAGATAGFAIATGYNPLSYGQTDKVRVGCIGTGGQGNFHLQDGIWGTDDIEVVAVCDVYEPHQRGGVLNGWIANAQIVIEGGRPTAEQRETLKGFKRPTPYYDYKEMIEKENLDAVIISTGLAEHYEPTMYALDQGLYVFCEKTMCFDIEEGRNVVKKAHEKGKWVQVGHQRRYNPNYNLAMKRFLEEGWLGRVNHMEMQWHRNNAGRRVVDNSYEFNEMEKKFIKTDLERHLNWRLYEDLSGGLSTELLTHSVDIANWFCGCVPNKVYASGGIDYWRDGRTCADNISVLYDYNISRSRGTFVSIDGRNEYQNVFEINKPYTVRCFYSCILANAKKGASEMIMGDKGAIEMTEDRGCWFTQEPWAKPLTEEQKEEIRQRLEAFNEATKDMSAQEKEAYKLTNAITRLESNEGNAGELFAAEGSETTADVHQFRAFTHHIKNGGRPRTNEMVGLGSTIVSMAAVKAIRDGVTVDIDPAWFEFDFDEPSAIEYDTDAKPIQVTQA
ncbi:MAG: Gfo/Idh/MocA family oxidoreductase [Candidatus Hydrogenedentes bacterium]|nr:Gfo/Idh/MocA family oxidoreductase [Candidatus Hydrogenedentota bacterium]